MGVHERANGDRHRLQQLIGAEADAAQRDRCRAVALAIDGRRTEEIMTMIERSRAFVQRWVHAYRAGCVSAIAARTPPGRPAKLSPEQLQALRQRLAAGPADEDHVCALRGCDIQQLIEREFGVRHSLNGVYDVLHRHGYSWLAPRPQHRQADPKTQEAFKTRAPPFVKNVRLKLPECNVDVWFEDELRAGQQGTLTRVWAPTGTRPTAIRQTEFK